MIRPCGYLATRVVTIATAPDVPRGPAPAAPDRRCSHPAFAAMVSSGPMRCVWCGRIKSVGDRR